MVTTPMSLQPRLALAALLVCAVPAAMAQARAPHEQLAFEIYKELVEIDTVTPRTGASIPSRRP